MIQPDKRPEQSDFANLTDYSLKQPEGSRRFFAYVHFEDGSTILWSNIFTTSRLFANMLVFNKFLDCMQYVQNITVYEG